MPRPFDEACAWYVGAPKFGKTHLALAHLRELVRESSWPALVVDSAGVEQFTGWHHAADALDAVRIVFGQRLHCAFHPRTPREVEAIAAACWAGRRVHLLIDESGNWIDANSSRRSKLVMLMRSARHRFMSLQYHPESSPGPHDSLHLFARFADQLGGGR